MIQLCEFAADNSSSYDKLHWKLFGEQPDGIRLIWEHINMMYPDFDSDDILWNYKAEFEAFKRLTEFYTKFGTLPLLEEKNMIGLSDVI